MLINVTKQIILKEFEKKLPANYPANMCVFPEKRRKEVFKNLISDIIGVSTIIY